MGSLCHFAAGDTLLNRYDETTKPHPDPNER